MNIFKNDNINNILLMEFENRKHFNYLQITNNENNKDNKSDIYKKNEHEIIILILKIIKIQ